ncbi:MAG: tRNA (adenosine(37)-N6)-threonylcarbamoyltransferase complex dimerization subunit type 1 TsaB [Desulfamplus sp.]|nr:tRNA (adenosine(37)-N6)-threonylcarbamoyltransferase complex dimerization subunit type 1 TsaB [Desulfamplus sp.]
MKILAVDTAEQSCSIALVEDNVPISQSFLMNRMTHSRTLMNIIVRMLEKDAGITIDDVDGFVAACGPGSFTGLRIGISIVKGLSFATSKPSAGVSSLDGIGFQFIFSSVPVCVMMDAKRGEVYFALYRFCNGRLVDKSEELVISPEKVLKIVGSDFCLFAGSGAVAFRPLIQKNMDDKALFVPPFQNFIKASALAHIIFEDNSRLSMMPNAITPVYLRRSDAEISYDQRHR